MRKFVYIVLITIFLILSAGLIDCTVELIKDNLIPSAIICFLLALGPVATVVSLYMGYYRKPKKKWLRVFVAIYWAAIAILAIAIIAIIFSKP